MSNQNPEFSGINLEDAAVEEKELNRFAKPVSGYSDPQNVVQFIESNDEVFQINLDELAVNGKVVADKMEAYLKTKAISSSLCKEVLKTPLHFYVASENVLPKESKKHFELGTFCHMAFLEPSLFEKVIVEPEANLASKDGVIKLIKYYLDVLNKAKYKGDFVGEIKEMPYECLLQAEKKDYLEYLKGICPYQVIPEDSQAIINVIKSNYFRYGNGIIPRLLKGAINEVSFYAEDPETGLPVKIRPDGFNTRENIGVDAIISFKTTTAESLQKFIYDSAKYKYNLSEGMYQEVASLVTDREVKTTITIMLQTVSPFACAVLWWDADDLENGKYQYHSALAAIEQCKLAEKYPGFDVFAEKEDRGIIKMKMPDWTMKELYPIDVE